MNIAAIIRDLRAQWASVSPTMPLYLQLAPETAQVNYAVLRFGDISPGDGDLVTEDYITTFTVVAFCGGDEQAIDTLDSMVARFNRGRLVESYSCLLQTATFDLEYTDTGSLWTASASFTLKWEVEV